uniref:LPD28 domain-containing protein n=1 Tax=Steinernema glaseri TaxID=37863 RepID=A0A1I7ZTJ9_9BILA
MQKIKILRDRSTVTCADSEETKEPMDTCFLMGSLSIAKNDPDGVFVDLYNHPYIFDLDEDDIQNEKDSVPGQPFALNRDIFAALSIAKNDPDGVFVDLYNQPYIFDLDEDDIQNEKDSVPGQPFALNRDIFAAMIAESLYIVNSKRPMDTLLP